MHIKYTWICFLLLSFTESAQGASCRWLQMYERYNAECFRLLKDMGGDFKSDGVPRLPDTQILSALYRSVNSATADDKIIFLHVATKQIVRLLNNSNVTNTWDKTKLDNLLNVLNQQSTNLGDCAAQVPTRMSKYRKQLKKHFRSLKKFLIEMKYSKQSWEQIRKEVERHLHRLLYLANTMVEY
ncbi:interferon a3-like isoform X2 [Alosa sapidissima]|uniref:interferon a3-like isoform X2 n=2 Tax=Alosa sapidissima TaxID=34773 RepID=UPI001C0A4C4E|nr:interferon a3-like isoform X2 [Alosa sapidissima]